MKEVFLSAGVPTDGRGDFNQTADPFLIQSAVREFAIAALGRLRIVWGGQPSITPMIWAICEDINVNYSHSVVLYQSKFFEEFYPDENKHFRNVLYVDAVDGDREASLARMREEMLSRTDLCAAVFIGGMDGILEEHRLFTEKHPDATVICVPSSGGAARQLARESGETDSAVLDSIDFVSLFYSNLNLKPTDERTS
jgi:hypothetical protein